MPKARPLLWLLFYGVVYALAFELGKLLYFEPTPVSVLWPSSGVAVAALVLARRHWWPAVLGLQAVLHVALALRSGGSVGYALGVTLADLTEAGLAAALLCWWCRRPPDPARISDLLKLLGAATVGTLLAAAIGASVIAGERDPSLFWNVAPVWFLGDLTGILVVTTTILLWRPGVARLGLPTRTGAWVELGILVALSSALVVWLSTRSWQLNGGFGDNPLILMFCFAWSALRFRPQITALLGLGVTFALVAVSDLGAGPFAASGRDTRHLALAIQIFVFTTSGVAMTLAAGLDQARREVARREASEQRLRITLLSIGDGVITTDGDGRVSFLNRVAEELTGWTSVEAAGKPLMQVFRIINADTRDPVENPVQKVLRSGQIVGLANHTLLLARDGREFQIADSGAPILDHEGRIMGTVLVFRDVTGQYRVEQQLRQAQKMEAIGQLAGGIAHDFNNMLSAIMGGAELLRMGTDPSAQRDRSLQTVLSAAERARELTANLLSFARRQDSRSESYGVDQVVQGAARLLERTLGSQIQLTVHPAVPDGMVNGDAGQLQSALVNLAVNARDAMPEGGELRISTQVVELDRPYCAGSAFDLEPGSYVQISVVDSGFGIPRQHLDRVFEPFFTTKGVGKGTGLGLAMVYACVIHHRGAITVYSDPGRGTVFHLYLPLASSAPAAAPSPEPESVPRGAGELVLVVDDEQLVRDMAGHLLEALGYAVMTAADGAEGMTLLRRKGQRVAVVLMDMVMPGMNGEATFRAMRAMVSDLPVILCSGFTGQQVVTRLQHEGLAGFLAKPYRSEALARELARVLRK